MSFSLALPGRRRPASKAPTSTEADDTGSFAHPQTRHEKTITLETILAGLIIQSRVINALIMREVQTRYGEYKIGFLWAIIEPLISVIVFVAIFSAIRHDMPGGMPLVQFMLIGIVSFSLFKDPWTRMQGAITPNKNLLAFPQVTVFDVLASRGILEALISLFVLGFLLAMTHLVGFEIRVERPLGVLAVCLLLIVFGIGLGFLFSSFEPILPSVRQLTSQVMGRPLFLGSGLFFNAESLPPPVIDWILYNPLAHAMLLIRGEFFHEFETTHGSWFYLCSWTFGSLAAGLVAHQAMRKRAVVGA